MNTRLQKHFVYEGFGFPVHLENVPMVRLRGVWVPKVDFEGLARDVVYELALHPSRLTGDQIRFIRQFFGLTLERFAERFGVSHPAVIAWERSAAQPTRMQWCTEKDIRLFILDRLEVGARRFNDAYRRLTTPAGRRPRRVVLDTAA